MRRNIKFLRKRSIVNVIELWLFVFISCFTMSCSTVKYSENDGVRQISTDGNISEKIFKSGNFFIFDLPTNVNTGLDEEIFKTISYSISSGESAKKELAEEADKEALSLAKGEIIRLIRLDSKTSYIEYLIYNKNLERYEGYSFQIVADTAMVNSYIKAKTNISFRISSCENYIEACNSVIENCSFPTVKKTKVEYYPHVYYGGASFGGKYDEPSIVKPGDRSYTMLTPREVTYDAPNPNYNPLIVSEAKEDLKYWTSEKNKLCNEMNSLPLPFELYRI